MSEVARDYRELMNKVLLSLCVFSFYAQAVDQHNHYANDVFQRQSPKAFALQPESKSFLKEAQEKALTEREALVTLVNSNSSLKEKIENFPTLGWDQKTEVLKSVFDLEVQALGMKAPELIIANGVIPGSAFFKFDIEKPGPGSVILNPARLQNSKNPYSALMLLVHETRHSSQFQRAFSESAEPSALSEGYKEAFTTQKGIFDSQTDTTFSDFLTLVNEYEAFQFGNYVVGVLTNFKADTLGFGTFASQYNADKTLKIDLLDLFKQQDAGTLKTSVLDAFNEAEKAQYDLLYKD